MALISQMYNIGGSSGMSALPPQPTKADINTTDFAGGTVASSYGFVQTSYQFWPVSEAIANHTFGLGSGGTTSFARNSVLVLRNDATGTTVWSKAYTALPFSPVVSGTNVGDIVLESAVMDAINNKAYLFCRYQSASGTRYALFDLTITTGVTVQIGSWDTTTAGFPPSAYATTDDRSFRSRHVSFGRFTDVNKTHIEFFGVGGNITNESTNLWNVFTVKLSDATNTKAAVTPLTVLATESYSRFPDFIVSNGVGPYLHYVTKDKTTVAIFIPKTSSQNSFVTVIYRSKGRAVLIVTDKGQYQYPAIVSDGSTAFGNLLVTDSQGRIGFRKAGAAPGVWDSYGSLDYYDVDDLDRWIKEIADNANLPVASALW